MIVTMIGSPGSGKSSVGRQAANDIARCDYFSTGEFARSLREEQMDTGGWASEDVMREKVADVIKSVDGDNALILDGFPRTVPQWIFLKQITLDRPVIPVILDCPRWLCIERLNERGRESSADLIYQRLIDYDAYTVPLAGIVSGMPGTLHLSGTQKLDETSGHIVRTIIDWRLANG